MKPNIRPPTDPAPATPRAGCGVAPRHRDVSAGLRFLASVFAREPDRALLVRMRERRAAFPDALGGDPLAGLDLEHMDQAVEALAVEYCRLFIGPTGHLPPVESVVMEGQFQGRAAAEVEAFYQAHGLRAPDALRMGGPDHLALELEFAAALEERGLHEEAARFAREHLLRWLPPLLSHIESRSTLRFFPAWATALHDTLTDLYATAVSGRAGT